MRYRAFLTLVLVLFPALAQAQAVLSCGASERPSSMMETLKGEFRDGNFRAFLEKSGRYLSGEVTNYDSYFARMDELFPNGFDLCQTVLVREEDPGFRQEIVLYESNAINGPISLFLTTVIVNGREELLYFNFNSSATAILEQLR